MHAQGLALDDAALGELRGRDLVQPLEVALLSSRLSVDLFRQVLGTLKAKVAIGHSQPVNPTDAVLTVKAYFRYVSASAANKLERMFKDNGNYLDAISSNQFWSILPKAEKSNFFCLCAIS